MKRHSSLRIGPGSSCYVGGFLCCALCVWAARVLAGCSFIVIHVAILSYVLLWVGILSLYPCRLDVLWTCVVTGVVAFSGAVHGMLLFCPGSVDICIMAEPLNIVRHVFSVVWVYYVISICVRWVRLGVESLSSVSSVFEAVMCTVLNLTHVILTFYSFACRACVSPGSVYGIWFLLRVVVLHVGVYWLSVFQTSYPLSRRVRDLLSVLLPIMFVDVVYCLFVVPLVLACTLLKLAYSGLCGSRVEALSKSAEVDNGTADSIISVTTDDASRFTKLLACDQSVTFLKSIRVDLSNQTITPPLGITSDDARTFQQAKSLSRRL